ncbi:MAG: sel1 repeat family protein [Proteobacteria bacterium]|nr:sel1 repeat family protein [Pseudomonadota bacterium]
MIAIALILGPPAAEAQDLARALDLLQRQDYERAVPMLRSLAEAGDANAQAYYGGLFLVGIGGIPYDLATARSWLQRSAAGGNPTAAFNLGVMAEKGDGMPADPGEAFRWYRQAAAGGVPTAMVKVGKAYHDGLGVGTNLTEAANWLRPAAGAGDPDAQNLLALMIAKHETSGTAADAYAWFLIAAKAGQPDAAGNQALLRPQLSGTELAEAERTAERWRPTGAQ